MNDGGIGVCADYDSMGNHGRFPMTKKVNNSRWIIVDLIMWIKNLIKK